MELLHGDGPFQTYLGFFQENYARATSNIPSDWHELFGKDVIEERRSREEGGKGHAAVLFSVGHPFKQLYYS